MKTPVSILNYHNHSLKWTKFLTERRILLYHKHVFGFSLNIFLEIHIWLSISEFTEYDSSIFLKSTRYLCKNKLFIVFSKRYLDCSMANIFRLGHTKMSSKNQAGKPIVLFCTGSRFNGFELHRIGSRLF